LLPASSVDLKRKVLLLFLEAERKATGKKLQPQKPVKLCVIQGGCAKAVKPEGVGFMLGTCGCVKVRFGL